MRKRTYKRAQDPSELPQYECKRHGPTEPIVTRIHKNGRFHRRCRACLKESFDKIAWQRDRREREKAGLGPRGRAYKHAVVPEDFPQYRCKVHGETEPYIFRRSNGRLGRRCMSCYDKPVGEAAILRKQLHASYQRDYHQELRTHAIGEYGGRCACCGESDWRFLTIDHIKSDGGVHRKAEKLARHIYKWLRTNGYPKDGRFQVQCFQCNLGRAFNCGICPHKDPIGNAVT